LNMGKLVLFSFFKKFKKIHNAKPIKILANKGKDKIKEYQKHYILHKFRATNFEVVVSFVL